MPVTYLVLYAPGDHRHLHSFPTRRSSDLHRDDAEDETDGAALLEDVAAEAAEPRHAVGEIDFLRLLEFLPLRGRHHRRAHRDRKSTRLNSSHRCISYAVFCLKKKNDKSFL